ncbi:unnamed protein product [Eruca vesicaria subsp. sativa]|uniref:Uncharacterized protein n=1 Tax=Eruca vesicaria subsp. sativa TaxID=29727 RepID=A0ABC8IVJ5_ERUVS|nr:unnamed protein product [Eruca vesicaria subsp. sativa]
MSLRHTDRTLTGLSLFCFLKGHPNSRSFRIKSIPFYKDLCLIYSSDGMSEQKAPESITEGETNTCNEEDEEGHNRICEPIKGSSISRIDCLSLPMLQDGINPLSISTCEHYEST